MDKPSETITSSRRTFLSRSAILAAGVVALPGTGVSSTNQAAAKPVVDLSREKIIQFCLVVRDRETVAKRFEELLGIGNWKYSYGPPGLIDAFLNGKPVAEAAMQSLDVAFANGWLGDIQIEIIRPIGIRPGGCHQVFLDRHGNGIQHVSFGLQADYTEVVEGLKKAGIGSEFSASIKARGVTACYFATQSQLGGFQLEIVGRTES